MLSPIAKERLSKVVEVLKTVPDSEFDLWDWERCAVGHTCRNEWFAEQGLSFDYEAEDPVYCREGEITKGFIALADFFDLSGSQGVSSAGYLFLPHFYRPIAIGSWHIINPWLRETMKISKQEVIDRVTAFIAADGVRWVQPAKAVIKKVNLAIAS